jgi:hypothetical protein
MIGQSPFLLGKQKSVPDTLEFLSGFDCRMMDIFFAEDRIDVFSLPRKRSQSQEKRQNGQANQLARHPPREAWDVEVRHGGS